MLTPEVPFPFLSQTHFSYLDQCTGRNCMQNSLPKKLDTKFGIKVLKLILKHDDKKLITQIFHEQFCGLSKFQELRNLQKLLLLPRILTVEKANCIFCHVVLLIHPTDLSLSSLLLFLFISTGLQSRQQIAKLWVRELIFTGYIF